MHAQRGVALLVVLILLLVMSLMAVLSLRGTLMEERASANMMDRSLSFQAAEAALRQGESLAATKPALPAAVAPPGCARSPRRPTRRAGRTQPCGRARARSACPWAARPPRRATSSS
jgi:Tfp pilus assembly protein PilX